MFDMQPEPAMPADGRDDTVSLADLWHILLRRRRLIAMTFLLFVAAGFGYVFLKSPVYEASAKIHIGQVAGSGAIEPAAVLSTRLMAKYGEIVADGVKRPRPFLARAVLPKGVPVVIELVTEGDTPGDAVALLERIRADIHLVHDEAYRQGVALLTERLANLDAQRKALQLQLDESSTLLERLSHRDVAQASLVMLERSRIASQISGLDAERPGLAQKLLLPQTQPTELVGEIVAPTRPAAPRKVLIGALAVVLGLISGVMLALVADFLARAHR